MAVVIAADLGKDIAGEPLLRNVSFKLERRDRLTVAGRNGSGKTTLLRMLAGEAGIDGGELTFQKGVRVSLHDQRPPRDLGLSLRDYVLSGCGDLVALEQRLGELEQSMAAGATDAATLTAYADAQAQLEHAGGYLWRERAIAGAHGLGFGDGELDRRLDSFSGGELTRASLARALANDPELLLLDEPTNHLDIGALEWLEERLQSLDAAVILVAHDRWFLEAVGTCVLELEPMAGGGHRGRFFKGPWHAWRKEQAARELAAGRAMERQEAEIARLERFVDRFRAGTRARQAQSRAKKLAKIDRVDGRGRSTKALAFKFGDPERSGRVVFEAEGLELRIGERTLLERSELWLERGEHLALIGPNGAGKSTLIATLTGERELDAGKLRRGHNIKLGVLSQHAEDLDVQTGTAGANATILTVAQRATGLTPGKARALLGQFLFSGDDVDKPLRALSGGERQRLNLAILVNGGSNVLILDEPTNHLDIESREALEDALKSFTGSLILVSHDRALLDAVGTRTVAFEDRKLRSQEGGWADYMRIREERRATAATEDFPREGGPGARRSGPGTSRPDKTGPGSPAADGSRPPRQRSKNAIAKERRLEEQIAEAEDALRAVEDELADPAAWSTPERSTESTERHEAAKQRIDDLYAELERVSGG
jgi:ATP-binding cassette subfamily F protein 3